MSKQARFYLRKKYQAITGETVEERLKRKSQNFNESQVCRVCTQAVKNLLLVTMVNSQPHSYWIIYLGCFDEKVHFSSIRLLVSIMKSQLDSFSMVNAVNKLIQIEFDHCFNS